MTTPPAYSLSNPIVLPSPGATLDQASIPIGSPKTHHQYTQHRSSGNIIELRLDSYAPNSASTPFYWTGTTINGTVSLTLPGSNGRSTPPQLKDSLKAVNVELRGVRTVSSSKGNSTDLGTGAYERPFIHIPITLFESKTDDAVLNPGGSSYSWPFSFILPETFPSQSKKGPVFRAPPTLSKSGFQEFTKYEVHTTIKKGLLKNDELLVQQILILPQSTPLKLQSPLLLASFKHDAPVPFPHLNPDSWRSKEVSITFSGSEWVGDAKLQLFLPTHPYHARGTAIPLLVHLIVNGARPASEGSRLSSTGRDGRQTIYRELRNAIEITLESLYPIGHNAGTSAGLIWVDGPPSDSDNDSGTNISLPHALAFDRLPDPIELDAEVLLETVATSCQLWSRTDFIASENSGEMKKVDFDTEESIDGEGWLQGEIIPNANILPDFVFPTIRLSHAITLRLHPSNWLNIVSVSPAPSSNARKSYSTFTTTAPIISLPTVITTHPLIGDTLRSVAPVPAYR